MCFIAAVSSWPAHPDNGMPNTGEFARRRAASTCSSVTTHSSAAGKKTAITVHKIGTPRLMLQDTPNFYAICIPRTDARDWQHAAITPPELDRRSPRGGLGCDFFPTVVDHKIPWPGGIIRLGSPGRSMILVYALHAKLCGNFSIVDPRLEAH